MKAISYHRKWSIAWSVLTQNCQSLDVVNLFLLRWWKSKLFEGIAFVGGKVNSPSLAYIFLGKLLLSRRDILLEKQRDEWSVKSADHLLDSQFKTFRRQQRWQFLWRFGFAFDTWKLRKLHHGCVKKRSSLSSQSGTALAACWSIPCDQLEEPAKGYFVLILRVQVLSVMRQPYSKIKTKLL